MSRYRLPDKFEYRGEARVRILKGAKRAAKQFLKVCQENPPDSRLQWLVDQIQRIADGKDPTR